MEVRNLKIDEIKPYENNPRDNSKSVDKVAESISQYGFQQPIVVDKDMVIIVGHTRLKAAKKLGLKEVPVIVASSLNKEQVKAYRIGKNFFMKYSTGRDTPNKQELPNDMVDYLVEVLKYTNAGMAGMSVDGATIPRDDFIRERYAYSFFALKLDVVPDYFQGDFEDDIEFRLKLKQKNIPVVSVCPFRYGKTAQNTNNDISGNRQAYNEVGLDRGKNMSILYGDYYKAGISSRGSGTYRNKGKRQFRHELKSYKVGVKVKNFQKLKDDMTKILEKYATFKSDKLRVSESKSDDS